MYGVLQHLASALIFLNAAISAIAAPAPTPSPHKTTTVSGQATCFEQNLSLAVQSSNIKILLPPSVNQTIVTETLVELLQANSTLFSRVNGGPTTIKDTFSIYGKLCLPSSPSAAKAVKTVQFLTHGDTLDNTYWDIAPGYSYIDFATAAGYATFSYDRIGVGKSAHPDPLQVVQGPLQVEIAHALVSLLRKQQVCGYRFASVVGVGHSAGSTVTQGVTTKYPTDFDAVVLTGTSTSVDYVNTALASFDLGIADADPSGRFRGLGSWYLVQPNVQAIQFPYFRWPNFDPKLLSLSVSTKQTQTLGELLTIGLIVAPSTAFTGPIDVLLGANDLVFCGGDCTTPVDQSALVAPVFYPNAARKEHFIVKGAGHAVFAHLGAREAFGQIIGFLGRSGF